MFCLALLLGCVMIIAGLRVHFIALQSNDKSTNRNCWPHQHPARHHNSTDGQRSLLMKHTYTPPSTTSPATSHAIDVTCPTSSPRQKHCQKVHAREMRKQPHLPPRQLNQLQPRFKHIDRSTHFFFESIFTLFSNIRD